MIVASSESVVTAEYSLNINPDCLFFSNKSSEIALSVQNVAACSLVEEILMLFDIC